MFWTWLKLTAVVIGIGVLVAGSLIATGGVGIPAALAAVLPAVITGNLGVVGGGTALVGGGLIMGSAVSLKNEVQTEREGREKAELKNSEYEEKYKKHETLYKKELDTNTELTNNFKTLSEAFEKEKDKQLAHSLLQQQNLTATQTPQTNLTEHQAPVSTSTTSNTSNTSSTSSTSNNVQSSRVGQSINRNRMQSSWIKDTTGTKSQPDKTPNSPAFKTSTNSKGV